MLATSCLYDVVFLFTGLVQNLNKVVQEMLQHFGSVRQEAEKVN